MKQVILFLIILITSITFLLFTIVNSLGHNVISPSKASEYYLKVLMPQEWGFYSKDPKILDLAYVKIDGAEIIQPNANIKTAWGLNRKAAVVLTVVAAVNYAVVGNKVYGVRSVETISDGLSQDEYIDLIAKRLWRG